MEDNILKKILKILQRKILKKILGKMLKKIPRKILQMMKFLRIDEHNNFEVIKIVRCV